MPSPWTRIAVLVLSIVLASVPGLGLLRAMQTPTSVSQSVSFVRLVATATIPNDLEVDATPVGGLSGIDYDPETGRWIAISDDSSEHAPARFYWLDLAFDEQGISRLDVTSAVTLYETDGSPYPSAYLGGTVPDLESIRFDPEADSIWYTSEGRQDLEVDPFIAETDGEGALLFSVVPAGFAVSGGQEDGPRKNMGFEGMTFAADGRSLWAAMEGPLFQDGATSTESSGALVRFVQIDRSGSLLAQVAYPVDPLPKGAGVVGVTEILAVSEGHFLVLERAGPTVPWENDYVIRLYDVEIAGATDIADLASLHDQDVAPASKRLVLDVEDTGIKRVDNVEGLTWGPDFANGNRSLVLIADNNFDASQETQVIVLEVET